MGSSTVTIKDFMTSTPHGIEPHEPLERAEQRMMEHKVLHLPVRLAGKPVGILSDRDLQMVKGLKTVDFKTTRVADIMTPDPYCVAPETPLNKVCKDMVQNRYGSALVVGSDGKLVGIFTTTDALRALTSLS